MKITKKIESEIKIVMHDFWEAYLEGNLDNWSNYLVSEYRNIGTTEVEIWKSKKEVYDYSASIADQMVGLTEIRNKKMELIPYDPYVMVHEYLDIYIKTNEKWTFYSKLRLSSLIQKIDNAWKILHQHGSYPDSKVTDGEFFAFDKLKSENLKLQKAIKKRTLELEIEASLERVRTVAMGMSKSEDLLSICEVSFRELQKLGFDDLRNAVIHVHNDEQKYFMDYDFSDFTGGQIGKVEYGLHPIVDEYLEKIRSAEDAFFEVVIAEDMLEEWNEFRRKSGQMNDQRLDKAEALYYYLFSIGIGDIGISTFKPISESQIKLLKRFRNVFDLAYRRFNDITFAEAQAREAKIEAALEKVRARTMGMQHSDELPEAANLLFLEVQALNIPAWSAGYNVLAEDKKSSDCWMSSEGAIQQPATLYFTEEPSFIEWYDFLQSEESFFVQELGSEVLVDHYNYLRSIPDIGEVLKKLDAAGIELPTYQINHLCKFTHGFLLFITYEPVPEAHDIFKRFAKVFQQTYTRFLDLQKAEAQAREAQIETALERVRSRSMGMQKSEELKDVIRVVYEQFVYLKINVDHAGFVVDYTPKGDWHFWIADEQDIPSKITHPYFESVWANQFNEAKEKGLDFFATHLNFEEKNKFYNELLSYVPGLPKESKDFYLSCPGLAGLTVLFDNVSLYIENFSGIPYSNEENKILMRFGKVFQQTYTRFLDLQKAEAQARESEIELALERIRARTMAMQKSEDLADISFELVKQVQSLGVATWHCAFNIYDKDQDSSTEWGSNAGGTYPMYKTPREGIFLRYYEMGQTGETLHIEVIGEDKCADHYAWLCTLPGVGEQLLKLRDSGVSFPTSQIDHVVYFKYGYLLFITYEAVPEAHDIFKRFAKVFEQTYTRFLDLQKAEEQARESQIEAALERVRASAMGMHKSEEVGEVSDLLFSELNKLNLDLHGCSLVVIDEENDKMELWRARSNVVIKPFESTSFAELMRKLKKYMPDFFPKFFNALSKRTNYLIDELSGKRRLQFINAIAEQYNYSNEEKSKLKKNLPEVITTHYIFFKLGYLALLSEKKLSNENLSIAKRFIEVFDFAYTRFLDIKRAEEQAREAQIELSLERIRAQATAMRESSDLLDIVVTMRSEFVSLGHEAHYFWHMRWLTDKYEKAMTSGDGSRIGMVMELPRHIHGDIKLLDDWEKSEKPTMVFPMDVDTAMDYVNKMITQGDFQKIDDKAPTLDDIRNIGGLTFIMARTTHGEIGYSLPGVVTEIHDEDLAILTRFAGVFDLAHRRFEDLKSAEYRNRETQIELALERVRSKAMAMHSSEDLTLTVDTFFSELNKLNVRPHRCGVGIMNAETRTVDVHATTATKENVVKKITGKLKLSGHPVLEKIYETWTEQIEYHPVLRGNEILEYYNVMDPQISFPDFADDETQYGYYFHFKEGGVFAWADQEFSERDLQIFRRYTSVLSLTYRRYIDLKEAEAQAREAQIEVVLERVRSKAMAMHNSNDISDAMEIVFTELENLEVKTIRCGILIIGENKHMDVWTAASDSSKETVKVLDHKYMGIHPLLDGAFTAWKNQQSLYTYDLRGKDLKDYYQAIITSDYVLPQQHRNAKKQFFTLSLFAEGGIYAFTELPLPVESNNILERITNVFDLTYRRYKDLQKAEAQAREAQIEASLERIRARAMAMQSSDELNEVLTVLFEQFDVLGIKPIMAHLSLYDLENYKFTYRVTGKAGKRLLSKQVIDLNSSDIWKEGVEKFKTDKPLSVNTLYFPKEALPQLWEIFHESFAAMPEDAKIYTSDFPDGLYTTEGYCKFGYVGFHHSRKAKKEEEEIVIKFATEFGRLYQRFLDIEKAEAQARTAEQQASLDRVRGEIASMRTTEDLEKITPLIWSELTKLNIKFFRCGVFIIDEPSQIVKVYLTTPAGKPLAALHLPFNSSHIVKQSVKFWKEHKVYKEQWNREQFIAWSKSLVEQGHIKNTSQYQGGEKPPESLSLQFLPFAQGMLYVGSAAKLSEEEIETAQKLAESFGVAYARYEDFQKLEAANHRKSLELEEARQLQLAMLPKVLPQLPNLDIAVYMQTATEVGGDYYDFNVGENGELTAVIGDATGHGMKAGTIVTITKSLFNSLAQDDDILDTFSKISKVIRDMKFRQLSMCLMMLKIKDDFLRICSAAMPPALIYRKKNNSVEEIELKGMPLGAMENFPYKIEESKIASGDTILLMSDGLPELHSSTKEMYSYERIMTEFKLVGNCAPEKIIDHLKKSAAEWINGNDPDDDITFVVIKVK